MSNSKQKLPKLPYELDEVLAVFELAVVYSHAYLTKWLENPTSIAAAAQEAVESKRLKLQYAGNAWNEEELKMNFLAFMFDYADLNKAGVYSLFYERPLAAELRGYTLSVLCDSMVAKPRGVNTPDIPYFFMQEFKQQKGKYADAEAQMLQAMLVAQHYNGTSKPVFGCYIQGKNWIFSVLEGKQYAVSKQYDATQQDDLAAILSALVRLKTIIEQELAV